MNQTQLQKRALCLWLPNWPLQRLSSVRPELKHRAVVLYEQYRRGCFRVAACSRPASQQGIAIGMPLAEVNAQGSTYREEHDPLADHKSLAELAEWCEQFSPSVGLESSDCLFADATHLAPLFGGEQTMVTQIERAFHQRGFFVRVALADTFGTAWGVAHFGDGSATVVAPGENAVALAELPVAALRLPEETVELLTELGVLLVGQLLELPRDSLASRFGAPLLERLAQALGEIPESIASHRPPPEIVAEAVLEYSTDRREIVDALLTTLMQRVCRSLQERQQGVIQLECQFSCEQVPPVKLLVGLFRASADLRHLLDLTSMQLGQIKFSAPITAIRVSVLIAARLTSWQQELFAEKSVHADRRHLGLLVDRLSSRLGRTAVVRPVPLAEAQPEYAYRYAPLTGNKPRRAKEQAYKSPPLPRPLRLEPRPIPLEVLSLMPAGPPALFRLRGESQQIWHSWGPERIQTGWWRGRYIHRDYYRVETMDGNQFWLFRNLLNRKWFLHGVFD